MSLPCVIFVEGFHWSTFSMPRHKLKKSVSSESMRPARKLRPAHAMAGQTALTYFPSLSMLGWYIFVLNLSCTRRKLDVLTG